MEFKNGPKKKGKVKITLNAFIVGIVLSIGAGFFFGQNFKKNTIVYRNATSKIQEIYQLINDRWLNTGEPIENQEEVMINGMLSALKDPYNSYFTPESLKDFTSSINQNYVGIGISFNTLSGYPLITKVYLDGSASKAGLMEGDIILEADSKSLADLSNDEVAKIIKGEQNTTVKLKIQRGEETFEKEITRTAFDATMAYEIKNTNGKDYGLISILSFGNNTFSLVEKAMADMKNNKIDTIVFDLRNNPGGYLGTARDILNLLLEKDQVMFYTEDKNGKQIEYKATNENPYRFVNGYILMNHNSASSSEVLAGVLQEVLDYQVIGEQSYGKGVAQDQITLNDLSVLKVTTSSWLLPSKKSINGVGITPNILVENPSSIELYDFDLTESIGFDKVDVRIIQVQKMLKLLGYPMDREDGYFSDSTVTALKAFESDLGLEVNGTFDPSDKEILFNETLKFMYNNKNDEQMKMLESLIK